MFRRERRRTSDYATRLGAAPRAITRAVLDSAMASGRSSYPSEFGGLLRTDPPGIISELLLLPGTTAGRRHANFQFYMMPADLAVVGTVHSHPSGALFPSDADTRLFRNWGRRHVIIGSPFAPSSWRAYDSNARPVLLPVLAADGSPETPTIDRRPAIHRPE